MKSKYYLHIVIVLCTIFMISMVSAGDITNNQDNQISISKNITLEENYQQKEFKTTTDNKIYVSNKNGSDNNDGSIEHPYATLNKAFSIFNDTSAMRYLFIKEAIIIPLIILSVKTLL